MICAEAGPSNPQKPPRKPTYSAACSGVTETAGMPTIRGLLLDLLATGDRARVQDAAESFFASLERPSAG